MTDVLEQFLEAFYLREKYINDLPSLDGLPEGEDE